MLQFTEIGMNRLFSANRGGGYAVGPHEFFLRETEQSLKSDPRLNETVRREFRHNLILSRVFDRG